MNEVSSTPYEEIWGYRWTCDCGLVHVGTLPNQPTCTECKKPMRHVAPPVVKT